MRSFKGFSPYDFELFVADLLGAEEDRRYETFPSGPDGGIDLRYFDGFDSRPHVVQCKHYAGSAFSDLHSAAKKEAKRLKELEVDFASYRLVTSLPLTGKQKKEIAEALAPWIASDGDVLGANDIETRLDNQPAVERRQVKLWLTGGTQLSALLASDTVQRSQALLEDIQAALPRYVRATAFDVAVSRLRNERVLVIAGVPGIGKTTLARILLADAVLDGYDPIDVSADIDEAWSIVDWGSKQVFLYDDFLGRAGLAERFAKNEDKRLISFMRKAAQRDGTLFILTTREHILRQASSIYERLSNEGIDGKRFLLELPSYSLLDRARIFANHLVFSPHITFNVRRDLVQDRAYRRVIEHANYNPRIIEWICGLGPRELQPADLDDFVEFAVRALDHPETIWQHAFDNEIDEHERCLLLTLASMPRVVSYDAAEEAFGALAVSRGLPTTGAAFKRALQALDDGLIATGHGDDWTVDRGEVTVRLHNPSILDFLILFLKESREDLRSLLRAACFFEQVLWLNANASKNDTETSRLVVDGLRRTFDVRSLAAVHTTVGPNSFTTEPPGTVDFEDRLCRAHELLKGSEATSEDDWAWWVEQLRATVERWRGGEGLPDAALDVLALIDDDVPVDRLDAAQAAKRLMQQIPFQTRSMERQADLRDLVPDVYSTAEWHDVVQEMTNWVSDRLLDDANEMTDRTDLYYVEEVAARVGVLIDEDDLAVATEMIQNNEREHLASLDTSDDYDEDERRSPAQESVAADTIDAIFDQLASD